MSNSRRKAPTAAPGTCTVCLCTDERACKYGCAWADRSHTLCSACVAPFDPGVTVEILHGKYVGRLGSVVARGRFNSPFRTMVKLGTAVVSFANKHVRRALRSAATP